MDLIKLIARIEKHLEHWYSNSKPWPNGRANPDNDLYYILVDCKKALQTK